MPWQDPAPRQDAPGLLYKALGDVGSFPSCRAGESCQETSAGGGGHLQEFVLQQLQQNRGGAALFEGTL